MKKLFTLAFMALFAVSAMAQDWTVKIGSEAYPMTLVEGSSPETYTVSVELEAGNYAATVNNADKASNANSTTFTLTKKQTVQFWGQYPEGKNWIMGTCNASEYGLMTSKWRYITYFKPSFEKTSVAYIYSAGDVDAQFGFASKAPSDDKLITANQKGYPSYSLKVVDKTAGIKKAILDYEANAATIDVTTTIDVNMPAEGATTLVAPAPLTIPEGVKAYTLSYAEGTTLSTTEVETTIPANTPVLLVANEGAYSFEISGDAEIATEEYATGVNYNIDAMTEGNALVGVLQPHYAPEGAYVLKVDEEGLSFVKAAEKTIINTTNCYVVANTEAETLVLDSEIVTGISEIGVAQKSARVFNLAGQVVDNNFRGIVIKNGKKYVNK